MISGLQGAILGEFWKEDISDGRLVTGVQKGAAGLLFTSTVVGLRGFGGYSLGADDGQGKSE